MPRVESPIRILCARPLITAVMGLAVMLLPGCGAAVESIDNANDNTLPSDIEPDSEPIDNDDAPPDDGDDEPDSPDDDMPTEVNRPPHADAGADQVVDAGARFTLDGLASSDPDGDALTYTWVVASNDAGVTLSNANQARVALTAPLTAVDTVLRFTLTVSDGTAESLDDVEVLVLAALDPSGFGPTADAGADQTVDAGALVTLDGSASTTYGGALVFVWTQLAGPGVTLTASESAAAQFTAPSITGADSILVFELDVSDGPLSASDSVTIVVRAYVAPPPPPPPPPPPSDDCPNDPDKTAPGLCGCGVLDTDSDADGSPDCLDGCASDPAKTSAGACGCGIADADSDGDGALDCVDTCPNDPAKTAPGACGCGVAESDSDGDGVPNCLDGCPNDPGASNPALCPDPNQTRDTDWELQMLRLVNRARRDPAGEAARIGSSVSDTRVPVPPVAYDLFVADSAQNHTDWMHDNFGSIASGRTPDSFSHFETLDGQSTGTAAVGTPSYTGANVGQRLDAAGYPWSNYGENIQTNYSSATLNVDLARIESAHRGWWESSGHRNNMLNSGFTAFGFHAESRAFTPPRGGLNAPFDNLFYATQCFGRPLSSPRTYLSGLVYRDLNNDGSWTPRAAGDPLREGLAGVDIDVYAAGSATLVASDETMGHGAFAVRLATGTYDVVLSDARLPGGTIALNGVVVGSNNAEISDVRVAP